MTDKLLQANKLILAARPDAAALLLDEVEQLADQLGHIREQIEALLAQAVIARQDGQFCLANYKSGQALRLALDRVQPDLLGRAYLACALTEFQQGRLAAAESLYDQALKEAVEAHDLKTEARILHQLGACSWHRGNLLEARSYLEAVIDIHRGAGNWTSLGATLLSLSSCCTELGLDDAAAAALAEVRSLEARDDYHWPPVERHLTEAATALLRADYQAVAGSIEAALELSAGTETPQQKYDLECLQGRLLLRLDQPADAARHSAEANRIAQGKHWRLDLALVRLDQARVLMAQGELERAAAMLQDAEAFLELSHARSYLVEALCLWCELYVRQGLKDSAVATYRRAEVLSSQGDHAGRSVPRSLALAAASIAAPPATSVSQGASFAMGAGLASSDDSAELAERARDLISRNELVQGKAVAEAAHATAEAFANWKSLARACHCLGWIATRCHQFKLAQQFEDRALALAEEHGLHELASLLHLGAGFRLLYEGRIAAADSTFGLALAESRNAESALTEAHIYYQLGLTRWMLGGLAEGFQYLNLGIDGFRQHGQVTGLARGLNGLAEAAFELGKRAIYVDCLTDLMSFEERPGMGWLAIPRLVLELRTSLAMDNLAHADSIIGKLDELDLAQAAQGWEVDQLRGRFLVKAGRLEEAASHLAQAKRAAQASRSRAAIADIRLDHARALIGLSKLEHASAVLLDAETMHALCERRARQAETCCVWVEYYLACGKLDAAAASLHEARAFAARLEPIGFSLNLDLAKAANALGQAASA